MPPFFFWGLGSSLVSLFWILFQIDCLSPLHLVVLLGFNLSPLSATYIFVISFCQTYCLCGLLSIGCRILSSLDSGVCPLVGKVSLEVCAIIPLIGSLVIRACPGYWIEPPLCSADFIALSEAGLLPSFWSRSSQIYFLAVILICGVR